MIRVGVNEPVYLSKVEKNEQGTIAISFTEAVAETKKKLGLLEQANEGSDTSGSNSGTTQFLLFPPSREFTKDGKKEKVAPEKLLSNLIDLKNQLVHILKRYTLAKNISFNVVKGMPVTTDEQLLAAMEDEGQYAKVYANIIDQFMEQASRFKIVNSTVHSRLLLVRQSREKHFGRLRDKYLDEQPFLEDVIIPKDKSKLYIKAGAKGATTLFEADADGYVPKFTDFEIKNGKDNPIQSASAADANTATPEDAAAVEGLFGNKPEEPINFGVASDPEPEGTDDTAPIIEE